MLSAHALFTVTRVCEMTGLSPESLDALVGEFADSLQVRRTGAGNRLFTEADVERLRELREAYVAAAGDLNLVRRRMFPETLPPEDDGADHAPPSLEAGHDQDADILHVSDDLDPPAIPATDTLDLLLETAEALAMENLKLRKAVDDLGGRCMALEEAVGGRRRGLLGFLRG